MLQYSSNCLDIGTDHEHSALALQVVSPQWGSVITSTSRLSYEAPKSAKYASLLSTAIVQQIVNCSIMSLSMIPDKRKKTTLVGSIWGRVKKAFTRLARTDRNTNPGPVVEAEGQEVKRM